MKEDELCTALLESTPNFALESNAHSGLVAKPKTKIKARVGIASDYSKKIGFFANLRAKYYDIPTSKMNTTFSRPATKHFIAGVEAGIQF